VRSFGRVCGAAPRLGSAFFSFIGTLVNLNFPKGDASVTKFEV
jgi:hypothetical protein